MTKLNKALLASTAIAFASGLALPAAAQDPSAAPAVVKSSKKMKIKLYGQIARHFGFVSDGENQQFRQGQNPNTSSRMGIDGRGKINKDWSLRTRFEFQTTGDTSLAVDGNQDGARGTGGFRIRHTDAIFSNKRLGAIWIGRGDTATNGTSETNLVPAGSAGHLGGSLHQAAQSVDVLDEDTGATIDTVQAFFNSFDGAGRATRIRYDTPSFAGFKASVSYIDASSWDAALRYSGGTGGTKVKGAVGFTQIRDFQDGFADFGSQDQSGSQDGTDRLNGSFSVMLPMGLGVTMSGAWEKRVDGPRDNAWNVNPSIWYTMKATELGPTTVELSYQHSENVDNNDDSGDAFAATLFQYLANTGTDTYATFRYYDVDRTGTSPDNVWVIGGGFRARF